MEQPSGVLNFFLYQNGLKSVHRQSLGKGGRPESSAEHSWSVAMMTWVLIPLIEKELGVEIDRYEVMKMSLVHDIVEIDAGDADAWNTQAREAIVDLEHKAIEDIVINFSAIPETEEMRELWLAYEENGETRTLEAKVVKACDRLCPLIYRVLHGNSYAGKGVDRARLDELFIPCVSFCRVTNDLYEELRGIIEERGYFDTCN